MPDTVYWNSVTGEWTTASWGGTLPVVGDTAIADGRSQQSMVTSLDRSSQVFATERVVNGDFATDTVWTKGSGWTIAAGIASAAAGSASDLSQAGILVIGRSYQVTFTVSGRTAGTITAKCGTGAGTARSTNATFVQDIVCAGDTALKFSKDSSFDGDIDDVSVVESVGLDLAKFETLDSYFGDVGTPDQLLRLAADVFIHRGRGKLYLADDHDVAGIAIDRLIIDTVNRSFEITLPNIGGDIFVLSGKAVWPQNAAGGANNLIVGHHGNPISDTFVTIREVYEGIKVFQYSGRLIFKGQTTSGSTGLHVLGDGYLQLDGNVGNIYIQTGGYCDFGLEQVTGVTPSIGTAYLLSGTLDATHLALGQFITTAYIAPTFDLIEDDKLTITNRIKLWE